MDAAATTENKMTTKLSHYYGSESEVVKALRTAVKTHGAEALKGHKFAHKAYQLAGEIGQEEWSPTPTLAIESIAAGMIFPQIMAAKVTGRTLWSPERIGAESALKVKLTISLDEGETTSELTGWLW